MQKAQFRLTSVAPKRCRLSALRQPEVMPFPFYYTLTRLNLYRLVSLT